MRSLPTALRTVLVLAASSLVTGSVLAQGFPSRPVRVVVPFPPGGGVDFVARTVAQRASDVLKQPFVVENRSGAGGAVGAEAVAKSVGDGYTLLVGSPGETLVSPLAGQKVSYNPEKDLVPVTLLGETPLVIAAHPSVAAKSMQELIALARQRPGKLSYGTPGGGSSMHFAGESFKAIAQVFVVHIPYRGAAPVVTDLVGGQIELGIVGMPPTVPHMKAGKLRILAVTSDKRSPAMPEVPALAELPGFAGYRFTNWMGVFAPGGTPAAIVEQLAAELTKIVREVDTAERLRTQGVEPAGGAATDFQRFLREEHARYAKIARERKISATE